MQAQKWSHVWRNAPELDLEGLIATVGQPTATNSEEVGLYVHDGEAISLTQFKGACRGYSEKRKGIRWMGTE